jgi:murein DD-endopeptidase MepM/ murein hydrolase activator NlpD
MLVAEDLIHIVGRGETIFSLSRFYGVTAEELMKANGISDPSRLQAGRRLVIPSNEAVSANVSVLPGAVPASAGMTLTDYRVVRGDTLFSIARTHGITLQTLLDINRFSSNHVLRAGEVIKVPQRGAPAVTGNNTAAARNTGGIYSLRWPVNPRDISYMTGEMGVIVEGEQFEPVRSLTQGSVVSAGPWRKFGRVVIVETAGGYYYMYGGCETISVSVGDRITPGMELGRLGINAVSERPHLFFMVFRNDKPIDPATAPRAGAASNPRT